MYNVCFGAEDFNKKTQRGALSFWRSVSLYRDNYFRDKIAAEAIIFRQVTCPWAQRGWGHQLQ